MWMHSFTVSMCLMIIWFLYMCKFILHSKNCTWFIRALILKLNLSQEAISIHFANLIHTYTNPYNFLTQITVKCLFIYGLAVWRWVRPPHFIMSVLEMKSNHLMVRLQSWSCEKCGILLLCHYSQIHSDLEW